LYFFSLVGIGLVRHCLNAEDAEGFAKGRRGKHFAFLCEGLCV
jgi:hypothetical protein